MQEAFIFAFEPRDQILAFSSQINMSKNMLL